MEYLRGLFGALGGDEAVVEARCLIALSLWIANHFLAADHEGRSRAEVLERAVRLLEGQPDAEAETLASLRGAGRGADGSVPVARLGLDPLEFLEHPSHGFALPEAKAHLG
jgi:hypothetical protein